MGLLIPVLLLGLVQPSEQSIDLPAQGEQIQGAGSSSGILAHKFAFSRPGKAEIGSAFNRMVIHNLPDAPRKGCLTMRSYHFERNDGRAPEFVGMTTCEPVRKFTTKKVDRPARFVPVH